MTKDPVKEQLAATERGRLDKQADKARAHLAAGKGSKGLQEDLVRLQKDYMTFCKRHREEDTSEYMKLIDDLVDSLNA